MGTFVIRHSCFVIPSSLCSPCLRGKIFRDELLKVNNVMKSVRFVGIVLAIVVASRLATGAEPTLLSQDLLRDGWIQLFDGDSLFGWQPIGDAQWKVEEGTLRTAGDKAGFLTTTTAWADYELHVEFMATPTTNSGLFLRTPLQPTDPAQNCYELNIAPPDNPFPTASLVSRQKTSLAADKFPAADQWHTFDVIVDGPHVTVTLDGEKVLEYTDPQPLKIGHIGLQSREAPIAFRNIRLRPLALKSFFNGHDLTEWNVERAGQSQFEVTDAGELRVLNGPGQIESNGEFANFVLQLDCRVEGERLNSGIFFRTLRQGVLIGYESQISNTFKDDDPTKPSDFGTGGIYRRQPARRIVAGDREWFTKTLVADGPHIAVWVNGYQVNDWTDPRPPHESPREGRRDGPGAIAFQGHDPTTDFSFRNMRIVELPR
jgi:hypothetical protein